jgi:hypothetical protein
LFDLVYNPATDIISSKRTATGCCNMKMVSGCLKYRLKRVGRSGTPENLLLFR